MYANFCISCAIHVILGSECKGKEGDCELSDDEIPLTQKYMVRVHEIQQEPATPTGVDVANANCIFSLLNNMETGDGEYETEGNLQHFDSTQFPLVTEDGSHQEMTADSTTTQALPETVDSNIGKSTRLC